MTPTAARKQIPAEAAPAFSPTLLIVDDDRTMRMMLEEALQRQGFEVLSAANGAEALALLKSRPAHIDAVVLDREMPGINGLEVVRWMKEDAQLARIPVIMLTGTAEQERIQEGIEAGIFYYLVKPITDTLLKTVIDSAMRERRQNLALLAELRHRGAAFKALRSCRLTVRTLDETEDTAYFLASCFPDPERAVTGLMALLMNALEHGNLAIADEDRQRLIEQGIWREEIQSQLAMPQHAQKTIEALYQLKDGNHIVQITDSGAGFDWRRHWHINPSRATASHGRGIARARLMAFDRMAYNEAGNQVTVSVSCETGRDYAW